MSEWLSEIGYPNLQIEFTGKIKRFSTDGKTAKNGWCVGYKNTFGGKTFEYAVVGNWATDEKHVYKPFNGEMAHEDHEKFRRQVEAATKKAEEERLSEQKRAADEARVIWDGARGSGSSPYLERKKIEKTFGCRFHNDSILIPCFDEYQKLWGFQRILPSGEKRFCSGQRKTGTFHCLQSQAPRDGLLVFVCEGFSTAASLAHCLPTSTVYAAFDAGNLGRVGELVRKIYPTSRIIIAADNDQWGRVNVGIEKATETAKRIGAEVAYPEFTGATDSERDAKPTDWNDLYCLSGRSEVLRQLSSALRLEPGNEYYVGPSGSHRLHSEGTEIHLDRPITPAPKPSGGSGVTQSASGDVVSKQKKAKRRSAAHSS